LFNFRKIFSLNVLLLTLTWWHLPCLADPAPALPTALASEQPTLAVRGGGLLRVYGFKVYNIHLWTPLAASFDAKQPHALSLQYLRSFSAVQLADRSIDEMRAQGAGDAALYPKWREAMLRVFKDVKANDQLTGVVLSDQRSRFYLNEQLRGEIADPAFAEAFFGIWLNEKTSQPEMRLRLLGKQ
jgi:Chalcone isomerase-like